MRRRLILALGLSLGLHVLLFALLLRVARETRAHAPVQQPIAVEIRETPRTTGPRPQRAQPGPSLGAPRAQAPPKGTVRAPPGARGPPDAPLVAPNLFPEGALAVAVPGVQREEPPDAGSPAEVLAARIQGWRLGNLAEQRVATGVDSYFSTLAHALRDGMGTPPPPGSPRAGTPSGAQRWIKGWLDAVQAADAPPDPPAPPGEPLPEVAHHDLSGREADMIRRLLGPMAPTQSSLVSPLELFKKTQLPPAAVLRIVQDADGHLVAAELLASSGDASFDAWVRRSAALALAAVPRPPHQRGAGLHPDGTKSDWAFYRQGDGVSVVLLRVY
jgi:hypothetical protein